jgi:apolipoprotein N-acyltransferase
MALAVRIAGAGLCGLLLALAFAPHDWWWALPVAVAGLTACCRGLRPLAGFVVGWVFGLCFVLLLMPWLRVIGSDAWVALSVLEAVFYGLLGAVLTLVLRLPLWPVWAAAAWVGAEQLRSTIPFGGLPWGRLAFALGDTPMAAYARLGGVALLTAAAALLSNLLLALVDQVASRRLLRREPDGRDGLAVGAPGALAGYTAAAVAVVAVGAVLPVTGPGSPQVEVAVVQGDVPGSGLTAFSERRAVLDNHTEATHQLAADVRSGAVPAPDLVIWPENSTDIDPFSDPAARASIQSAVSDIGVPTLVGAVVNGPDADHVQNMGVVWDPTSGPGERYVKRHPVPFGEYIPFRDLLTKFIDRLSQIPKDFARGTGPGVLRLGDTTIGDVICFEVAYDGLLRDVVNGGAQLVVVQTNNATYLGTGQLAQQWEITRLRAIELGRTVVVASTDGISGMVGPDGTVLAQSRPATRALLVQPVTLESGVTPAVRYGSVIEWTTSLVAVFAAVAGVFLGRRRRSVEPEVSRR